MTCMALLPAETGAGQPAGKAPASGKASAASQASGAAQPSAAGPPSGAYGAKVLQKSYFLGAQSMTKPTGGTDTVAVVDAYNDPHAAGDLAVYRAKYGLPICTVSTGCLKIVGQDGGSKLPAADPTGDWALEESLDLDMVSAVCPYCKILLVEAKSELIKDLAAAEKYAAAHASAVSNSWGSGAEFVGENSFDAAFFKPGVAITASAGDDGYGTQWPAASPYVTAVGGTSLQGATTTNAGHQTAWEGTGSGCSALEPRPSWQASVVPGGCLNRTEADVSAVADPDHGVAIYDSVRYGSGSGASAPKWTSVGGTSVGAPVIAAAYALADISTGKPGTGLIPGTLPAAYPYRSRLDFTDISAGSNGTCESGRRYLCRAAAGFDGPTGLGTPNGTSGLLGPRRATVTVINPGTQAYQAGTSVRLPLRSLDSGKGHVAWSAAGLPAGLKVSGGVISGKLSGGPGVHPVTVTAADGSATGTATFSIVAVARMGNQHAAAGPVRLGLGGKCLDDPGGSRASGTKIKIHTCNGRAAQRWTYRLDGSPGGPGELTIRGKCLTIKSGTRNGSRATLQSCASAASKRAATQRWQYQAGDQLDNPHAGRCLADPHASKVDGRQVELWSCNGRRAQSWRLPPAPVLSGVAGMCLTDPAGSDKAGTSIEISGCSASDSQKWVLKREGSIRIQGRCLAVPGGGMTDGAAVKLARCRNSLAQRWEPGPHGQLVNENSGRCLTDPANATTAGTRLTQSDCYGQPGQIWAIS
jgi:hypothetical protein